MLKITKCPPHLSKSRHVVGIRWWNRLFLNVDRLRLADPVGPSWQAVSDVVNPTGELERQRFPRSVRIEEQYCKQDKADLSPQRCCRVRTWGLA